MKHSLNVPPNFNFWRTVYSHGWCALPPFEVIKESHRLRCIIELSNGKTVIVELFRHLKSGLVIEIHSNKFLSLKSKPEIISKVKSCLRLEEDYSEFYREAKTHKRFQWVPKTGAGRMLRAPTVFEDVVKMICTTNCSWALTEIMVRNLCKKLGDEVADLQFAFPRPEAIASQTEKFLRKEIRVGYRAPYLLELSRRVVKGDIDLESWRSSDLTTKELFDQVRSVKGIGPYAAGNILKLLGRYDYLGIDSWCRKEFFNLHRNGKKVNDKVIERYYESFGKWKGLFFWLDVTKHWYDKKFPF